MNFQQTPEGIDVGISDDELLRLPVTTMIKIGQLVGYALLHRQSELLCKRDGHVPKAEEITDRFYQTMEDAFPDTDFPALRRQIGKRRRGRATGGEFRSS